MNKQKNITLEQAVEAARALPHEVQELLARELLERVEDFAPIERPADRQAVITERLAKPLHAISRDELMTMLRQYNADL